VNPIALTKIAWKYYIVFYVLLAVFLVLIWFLVSETNGRTLEGIAKVFGNAIPIGKIEEERDEEDQGEKKIDGRASERIAKVMDRQSQSEKKGDV
jgi:hypothetical protein